MLGKIGCSVLGLSVLAWLSANSCTTTKEKDSAVQYTEEEQAILVKAKKEMEIGRNMAGRLLRFYGVHDDQKLVRYVNEVGNFVASHSAFPERRFMFDILKTEDVNAYACPGGYILLTMGAIRKATSEAELASIIAHEITHVGKEHMLDTLINMSDDEMDGKEKKEGSEQAPMALMVRKRPEPRESKAGALLAKYIGGSVAGLNALKAAKAGMSIIMEKGLGAELEFEADALGSEYAINSGYAPYSLANYLCRLYMDKGHKKADCFRASMKKQKEKDKSILDKTHPSVPARIANILAHLKKLEAKEIVGAKGKGRFIKMRNRLPSPEKISKG